MLFSGTQGFQIARTGSIHRWGHIVLTRLSKIDGEELAFATIKSRYGDVPVALKNYNDATYLVARHNVGTNHSNNNTLYTTYGAAYRIQYHD